MMLFLQIFSISAQNMNGPVTEPLPYQDVEFPEWAHEMRRFEVILFGSFPITYVLTSMVYELTSLAGSEINSGFSLPSSGGQDGLKIMLISSVSLSAAIALADLIVDKVQKNKYRNEDAESSYPVKEE
jgi:hypothetical protein